MSIVIVGARPNLGAAVARRFGREGFAVGLVSRTQSKVDDLASELATDGIRARGAAADIRDPAALSGAIASLAGKEKISYLPRKLRTKGSPGFDPEDGDLIYYAPWGNLGCYYDASGIGFWRDAINLGSYRTSAGRLARRQRGRVAVRVLPNGASS